VAGLAEKMGANVIGLAFVVELSFLHGRDKLTKYDVNALLKY
jgi:adenine phosphoribosyltransferase